MSLVCLNWRQTIHHFSFKHFFSTKICVLKQKCGKERKSYLNEITPSKFATFKLAEFPNDFKQFPTNINLIPGSLVISTPWVVLLPFGNTPHIASIIRCFSGKFGFGS